MSIGSHGLEVGRDYELNIGSSFLSGRAKEAYHLMRYDFKPASIDTNRPALFVVGENKQCTVTLPNIQDSGNTTTTYKGGKKSCTKECVLIIDKQTGKVTLERITSTIPLKKCRADKGSTVAKAHSEMENMESMERTGNLKKMLKGRDKVATKGDKSDKKNAVSNKPSKDASQATPKPSKSSVHPANPSTTASTLNSASTSATVHNSSGNTSLTTTSSVHSSTVTTNGFVKANPAVAGTIPRKRLMSSSDMSVSSTSSDSSDSDSGDEGDSVANQLGSISAGNPSSKPMNPPVNKSANPPTKSANPPPRPMNPLAKTERPAAKMERSPKLVPSTAPLAKVERVKGKDFLSTLQSDLQLSDSNDSDSD